MYCLECVFYAKIALSKHSVEDMRVAYDKRKAKTTARFALYWNFDSCERCGNTKVKATRTSVGI